MAPRWAVYSIAGFLLLRTATAAIPQQSIPLVDCMPALPSPWVLPDYLALSRSSTAIIFDATSNPAPYMPLLWWDDAHHNVNQTTFGIPSYVGGATGGSANHEAIAGMGAVLSAALTGTNMTCHTGPGFTCVDFERMLLNYFDVKNGVWVNVAAAGPNAEFWYQVWSSTLPILISHATGTQTLVSQTVDAALTWAAIAATLGTNFNWSGIKFDPPAAPAPFTNGNFIQPAAAAGLAFVFYTARVLAGEDSPAGALLLGAATQCLEALFALPYDPFWEVLLPFGAYTAARMNAEQGTTYDVSRLVAWVLQDDATPPRYPYRYGWGAVCGAWGDAAGGHPPVDVSGLIGSVTDRDGYAFAMDTFVAVGAMLPLARYDASLARALAKWASHAVNSAAYFFPGQAPGGESDREWLAYAAPNSTALAYEGLRRWGFNKTDGNITGPYATGDPKWAQQPLPTNLAIYGGAYVGLLGAVVVQDTGVADIIRFNVSAVDWHAGTAFPSSLLYNPRSTTVNISLTLPQGGCRFASDGGADGACHVYDAVRQAFLACRIAAPSVAVDLAADSASVLVAIPAKSQLVLQGDRLTARYNNNASEWVVVDWHVAVLPTLC